MKTNLIKKFRPANTFDFKSHILRIARVTTVFYLLLFSLNLLINLSFRFRLTEILTNQLWTSDEVINSNLSLSVALLLLPFYILLVQKEKSRLLKDHIFSLMGLHLLTVFLYQHHLHFNLVMFVGVVCGVLSVGGTFIGARNEERELMGIIQHIESGGTPKVIEQKVLLKELEMDDSIFI